MSSQGRVSIFDTLTARTSINRNQLRELVNFVVLNRSYRMSALDVKSLVSTRMLTDTPISSVFYKAIELRKDTIFSFLRIPPIIVATPEILTYTHTTFDLKQLDNVNYKDIQDTVRTSPEFVNTIVLNLTSLLKRSGELSDTFAFQSFVVRDLLSRSYYDNKSTVWLAPTLLRYLCRFYNMSMSSSISSIYNLSFQEQQAIATVFSLYFMQMCSDKDAAEVLVKTSKLGLGTPDQILDVISRTKDTLGDSYPNMSLDSACAAINNLGIARLTNIDRRFVYTRQRSVGPDILTSAMALEYPPYWCYLVLATLSGRKMGLLNVMKRNDFTRDAPAFIEDLVRSQSFLPAL